MTALVVVGIAVLTIGAIALGVSQADWFYDLMHADDDPYGP